MNSRWLRTGNSDTAFIFVHGINSDENAFRSDTAFWPEILMNETALDRTGVYIFEYQSQIFRPGYTLGDAVNYLDEMFHIDGVDKKRQLIFICHSMGGNLVRRYIVKHSLELSKKQVRCGLFMLACPSTGSHYANLFRLIRRNYHMQLESLVASQRNVWLNDLDFDFKSLHSKQPFPLFGLELFEDLPIVGRLLFPNTQVVPPVAAARYFAHPVRVPGSDHFTIAAPTGPHDFQHRRLLRWVEENFTSFDAESEDNHEIIAREFLTAVDGGEYPTAWSQLDDIARTTLVSGYEEFHSLFSSREQLGTVSSRKLVGANQLQDPPGYAKGNYKVLNYIAHYSLGGPRSEVLCLRRGWNGAWKPFSYVVSVGAIAEKG